jgi:hypothetical protein
MKTEPQREHQWLDKLAGEWTYEGEATIGPGKPPEKFRGEKSVRSIGACGSSAGTGEMPDGCQAGHLHD